MWVLYFCCYISSFGSEHKYVQMHGRILIYGDSAETYIYPHNYVKWKIDSSSLKIYKGDVESGILYLSRPYGQSIVKIHRNNITQVVVFKKDTTEYTDQINVRRRRKK